MTRAQHRRILRVILALFGDNPRNVRRLVARIQRKRKG